MGTRERREREKTDMRGKILSAARTLFADHGYEEVTMRQIADRIEYSPTAIYHHFANKQELVGCLCDLDFEEFAGHFGEASGIADPIERIRAIGLAYLQFSVRRPHHYRFLFMTVLPPLPAPPPIHYSPERDAYAMLRTACQEAIDQRRVRPDYTDADQLAQILWASLHGLISLRMVKGDQPWIPWRDLEQSARKAVEMMFHGILTEPEKS